MTPGKKSVLKIVTVDDSPIVAERLKEMLSEMDQVEFAGNACNTSLALELINQQNPNVIILDINLGDSMPSINGIDLLITLRRKYSKMKILMLTNLTERVYRDTCLFLGADYFFDKSNEFEKIPDTLNEILKIEIGANHDA